MIQLYIMKRIHILKYFILISFISSIGYTMDINQQIHKSLNEMEHTKLKYYQQTKNLCDLTSISNDKRYCITVFLDRVYTFNKSENKLVNSIKELFDLYKNTNSYNLYNNNNSYNNHDVFCNSYEALMLTTAQQKLVILPLINDIFSTRKQIDNIRKDIEILEERQIQNGVNN